MTPEDEKFLLSDEVQKLINARCAKYRFLGQDHADIKQQAQLAAITFMQREQEEPRTSEYLAKLSGYVQGTIGDEYKRRKLHSSRFLTSDVMPANAWCSDKAMHRSVEVRDLLSMVNLGRQAAINLCFFSGMTAEEAGETLGITGNRVFQRCAEAFEKIRRLVDGDALSRRNREICGLPGCENPRDSLGYCKSHARRFRSHGDARGLRHRTSRCEAS